MKLTEEQIKRIHPVINKAGVRPLLKWLRDNYRVDRFSQIPVDQIDEAIRRCAEHFEVKAND